MPSLPPAAPAHIGDAITQAMSRVDGCPSCAHNTEAPRAAVPVTNGWRCAYLCTDCRHAWTTDWMVDA